MAHMISRLIGLSAVALAGYDILSTTSSQAERSVQLKRGKRLQDVYMKTSCLDSESAIAAGLQNWSRNWHTGDNWFYNFKDNVTSHVSSFFGNIAEHFATLGLGAVALLSAKKIVPAAGASLNIFQKAYNKLSVIKSPLLGKVAAGLLLLKGACFVMHNIFGVGGSDTNEKVVY